MYFKKIVLLLFLFFMSHSLNAQKYLNLDFEKSGINDSPKGWATGNEGYTVRVDSTVSVSGKRSLCIQKISDGSFGVANSSFPVSLAKGKKLKYTGYIKTENVTGECAGLWWRVDGASGPLGFDNMNGRGPTGTTGWTKYTIEMQIDDKAQNINFGVLFPGSGKVWFDNLQIELDGKLYEDKAPETVTLTEEQMEWLRNNINTFESAEPSHSNDDLNYLKSIVGDARIVALGEGTHGTSEFFKMKHRITKYLAEEMGFSIFAIEANMPEAKAVNDYIMTGAGDPKKALAGMYFWTWNTQEVLDMIEWMKQYNSSGKGKIEFYGFDMQYPAIAAKNVLNFIKKYDNEYFSKADENYKKVTSLSEERSKSRTALSNEKTEPVFNSANDVYNYLTAKLKQYEMAAPKDTVEWAIQNAGIVKQCIGSYLPGNPTRDECMAYNTSWILDHSPKGTKIVLWAHNGHVQKEESAYKSMGTFLNEKYGKEMVVFGFGFHEGSYTAVGKKGLGIYTTSSSQPGSLEWFFHNTGKERLCLDLRKIPKSPLSKILSNDIDFRSIGAMAMDEAFYPTRITDQFDAVIYFDKTTPSACFGFTKK